MSPPSTPKDSSIAAANSGDLESGNACPSTHERAAKPSHESIRPPNQQSSDLQTFLLLAPIFLSMFLVAMDRTIISTAIPRISDEFNALSDVGWYGSVYLLTCCAFQLLFGKLYAFFSVKHVLLSSIIIFEAASALCGAAPSSAAFIAGRAFAGVGSAGIFAGTIVSIVHALPLAKRPKAQGLMGAIMGLATVIGPLIGGGFTSHVTWRWCFYINLPFGAVTIVAVHFFLRNPDRELTKLPLEEKLLQLDVLGTILLVPAVICLLLALQWGGQVVAWNDRRIIALLTLMGVLSIAFVAAQVLLPKTATVPPRILKYRSVSASFLTTICVGSSQYIFVYYLPIWFQAVKGVAPVDSGIRLLPLMLAFVLASISGGFLNQKIGYYTALGITGACLMSMGAGLLTTLEVHTPQGRWIGYQILYGFGMGLCFQTPNLATQTVLPKPDVPMGIALMFFGQLLGAAIILSVADNVLVTQLQRKLAELPGFDPSAITSGGATSLLSTLSPDLLDTAIIVYNDALRTIFRIGLVFSCLAVLGTSAMEWKNILKQPEVKPGGPPEAESKPNAAATEEN